MVDLVVLGLVALLVLRGWARGLVREAFDLAAFALGIVVAFRLAAPLGHTVAAMSGLPEEPSQMIAGLGSFVALSVGAAIVAGLLHRGLHRVPALGLLDRTGGAGLGALYAILLVTVVTTFLRALPLPPPVDEAVRSSQVATALARPDGPTQRLLAVVSGNRVPRMLLAIDGLVGEHAIVLGSLGLPSATLALGRPDGSAGAEVFDLLNRRRIVAGVEPLSWSDPMAVAALVGAQDRYGGQPVGPVEERLGSSTLGRPVEVAALAATPDGAVDVLLADPESAAILLDPDVTSVGIAVVSGPVGEVVDVVVD